MKELVSIASVVGSAILFSASAAPRAWWHFDEMPIGTTTTASSVFTNAVNDVTFPAIPREQSKAVIVSDGDQMPAYRQAFPEGHYLYDPVTDTVYTNTTAIWCGSATGGATGRSGCVLISDDGLYGDAFTLEFMLRCDKYQTSTWETILTRLNADGNISIVLRQLNGGFMGKYAYVEGGERKTADFKTYNCYRHGDLLNEKWHHVALSVDQVNLEMKLYVDYELAETVTLPGRLDTDDTGMLRLGIGMDNWGGNFSGLIDEVRVSDAVLTSSQFLRAQRMDLASVLYYCPFSPYAAEFGDGNMLRNEVTVTVSNGSTNAIDVAATAASVILHEGATAVTNVSALGLQKAYVNVPCTDAALQSGDFTIETMIRIPADGTTSTQNYLFNHASGVIVDVEGRTLIFKNPSWSHVASVTISDDKWHHVAYVADRTNGKLNFYFDYELLGTASATLSTFAADSKLWIGAYNNASLKFNSIGMDELRVSRGVLEASDFIHPAHFKDSQCLVSFDPADFALWGMGFGGKAVTRKTWGEFTIDDTERPGVMIYDGAEDAIGYTNQVSAGFFKKDAGTFSGFYKIPDKVPSLTTGSFTAEMFVKVDSKSFGGASEATPCFLGLLNRYKIEYQYWNDAVIVVRSGATLASAPFTLGSWYHLACVQDVENDQVRFYVNRKLVGTKNGIPEATGEAGSNFYVMGAPNKDCYGTFLNAWADEVRLTAGVLSPDEFLRNRRAGGLMLIVR